MPMEENAALDFYQKVTEGKEQYQTVTLQHDDAHLENVELHAVDKKTLAGVINRLPDEMFEAVEGAEDAEAAEAELEESGGGIEAISEETVEAFEDLLVESIRHPGLTPPQIRQVVEHFDFEVLFELGTEVINMSVEETGTIRAFQKQG